MLTNPQSSTLQLNLISTPTDSQQNSFQYLEQTLSQIGKHKKLLVEREEQNYKVIIQYESNENAVSAYQQFLNMNLNGFKKQLICFADQKPQRQPFADVMNEPTNLKQLVAKKLVKENSLNLSINKPRNSLLEKVKSDRYKSRSVRSRNSIVLKKGSSFQQKQQEQKENQPISKFSTFKSTMPKSPVILVSNLDNCFKNAKQIFNVFSVFGNIEKILLMKNLQKVMVEYKNVEGAYACAININCLKIKNTELRVNYSKYQHIDLNKNNQNFRAKNYNEIFIPKEQNHRFNKDHKDTNKKCSSSLTAKIEGENLNLQKIKEFLEKKSRANVVSELSNTENSVEFELTFFKFEDCVMTLAYLHDKKIDGNFIKVDFSQLTLKN